MKKKHKKKHKKHFLRGKRRGLLHGFKVGERVRVGFGHTFAGWCGKVECFYKGLLWVHLNEPPKNVGEVDGKLFYGIPPHMLVRI